MIKFVQAHLRDVRSLTASFDVKTDTSCVRDTPEIRMHPVSWSSEVVPYETVRYETVRVETVPYATVPYEAGHIYIRQCRARQCCRRQCRMRQCFTRQVVL